MWEETAEEDSSPTPQPTAERMNDMDMKNEMPSEVDDE